MRSFATFIFVAFCCVALVPQANGQLTFNLGTTGNANADAGFQMAADFWSSQFDDNIEINLTTGFANLGGGTLAQAGSTAALYQFPAFRTALQNDATTADDATFNSNIPTGSSFSVYINRTNESLAPMVDNDGGANNIQVRLSNSNAKALGLIAGNQAGQDAMITFNSTFNFDFDPTDGIGAGQQDFVGVAIHEIGHAMGFTSGVDVLDQNGTTFNDDQFPFVTAMDFARHSADSVNAGADIDWTADNRPKFYSIDGGATAGGGLVVGTDHFSLGRTNGDGQQASHWRDNSLGDSVQLGIMDPTALAAGNANVVSALDLQAFDIIGYDVIAGVPEPASLMVLSGTFGALLLRRRRPLVRV